MAQKKATAWSFGLSGSLNMAGMYGPGIQNIADDYEVSSRLTGNGGVYLSYAALHWLPIEAGAEINGKGYECWDHECIEGMTVDYQILSRNIFWEFPVCARPTATFGRTKVSFLGGMSYGSMFGASREVKAHLSQYGEDTTISVYKRDYFSQGVPIPIDTFGAVQAITYKKLYRPYDISLVLGYGFERMIGTPARYTYEGEFIPASTDANRLRISRFDLEGYTIESIAAAICRRFAIAPHGLQERHRSDSASCARKALAFIAAKEYRAPLQ